MNKKNGQKIEVYSNPNMTASQLLDYSLQNNVYVSLRETKPEPITETKQKQKTTRVRFDLMNIGC